jgi:biopolymer transport protein ExbB
MQSGDFLTDKFFLLATLGHDGTLYLLVLLSILSVAFILERWMFLSSLRANSRKIQDRVREILAATDLRLVEEMTRDRDTLEGRAISYGLKHVKDHGVHGLEEVFNSFSITERPRLERFLGFLATVGSNAPFIGLLGTVFGIMDAFRGLAQSQGDAQAVMLGISKALAATAIGLLVAIPAVVAYNSFQKQVRGILQGLEGIKELCLAYAKSKAVTRRE